MKASPLKFFRAQNRTYIDDRTGKARTADYLAFYLFPALIFGVLNLFEVVVPSIAAVGIVTVTGFLSAFLFGAMLQVAQRALDWADQHPEPSEDTTEHADYLRQLAANTGYASLVSIVAAGLFVVASATSGEAAGWFAAAGLALIVHLTLVLLMVMNRVLALTENRLIAAETGGPSSTKVSSLPPRSRRTG